MESLWKLFVYGILFQKEMRQTFLFFMQRNLMISIRDEVIELEIFQKWSQIYFMKSYKISAS